MNLTVGIVGLPNAGKSTLFNALLKKQAALAANYPFATIEPNVGVVPVPDERLNTLQKIVEKEEGVKPPVVPATIEFVDIAGLVEGAHKGEGLGNKFLSHIREVDMICHVVRAFDDSDIVHTASSVDPKRDIEIIQTELVLADLQTLENQKFPKGAISKEEAEKQKAIQKIKEGLENNTPARRTILADKEKRGVHDLHLLTMKPVLYAFNVSEDGIANSEQRTANSEYSPSVEICAQIESDLAGLSKEEQDEYLQSLHITEPGLNKIIQKAYEMLGLISFLTMGEKEVRAWTVPDGYTAPEAAGTIHTDFEKKFIKAEIVSFDTLKGLGSKKQAKEIGKLRLEGRDYIMQDGDVVEFKIGS